MISKNSSQDEIDLFIEEFIEYYGVDRIPNPITYPLQFEFLVKSYEHHLKMKEMKNEV